MIILLFNEVYGSTTVCKYSYHKKYICNKNFVQIDKHCNYSVNRNINNKIFQQNSCSLIYIKIYWAYS